MLSVLEGEDFPCLAFILRENSLFFPGSRVPAWPLMPQSVLDCFALHTFDRINAPGKQELSQSSQVQVPLRFCCLQTEPQTYLVSGFCVQNPSAYEGLVFFWLSALAFCPVSISSGSKGSSGGLTKWSPSVPGYTILFPNLLGRHQVGAQGPTQRSSPVLTCHRKGLYALVLHSPTGFILDGGNRNTHLLLH